MEVFPMNNIRGKLLRGFTVVELIVVIAILGVLFSIGTLAVSVMIRESNIKTANDSAHEALTYVQNWLVDLEIKNIDLDIFAPHGPNTTVAAAGGKTYFQLVSTNCGAAFTAPSNLDGDTATTADDFSNIKVCLLSGDPYSGGALQNITGSLSSLGSQKQQIEVYDRLKALSETLASTYDGRWRVIINATDYQVTLAYWQSADFPATQILSTTNYMFPAKVKGFTATEQSVQIAGSGITLMGQYPLATS
jgi:prepilin-type N-terminal cleavage/methylation domain-containing protein